MADKTFLDWPFFEPHHKALALKLDGWAHDALPPIVEGDAHDDVDATCRALVKALGRDGWLRLRRRYQFEYSTIGHDRQRGSLALLGGELLWITEPERASSPS